MCPEDGNSRHMAAAFPWLCSRTLLLRLIPHKLTHPTLSTAHPRVLTPSSTFGDSCSDALKLLGVWWWGTLGAPELAQAGTMTSSLVEGSIPAVGIPTAWEASMQEDCL